MVVHIFDVRMQAARRVQIIETIRLFVSIYNCADNQFFRDVADAQSSCKSKCISLSSFCEMPVSSSFKGFARLTVYTTRLPSLMYTGAYCNPFTGNSFAAGFGTEMSWFSVVICG